VLALGEATGAQFNLIPFSGGRNTIAAVVTGETDLGALPVAGVVERGDVLRVLLLFDDQNKFGDKAHNAPVVNDVFGTDLPPLVSSRAFALHAATFEEYPDEVAMLQESLKQVFEDPEHEQGVLQTGAPAEVIAYGGLEECQAYVENIIEIGNRFKPLLTGEG
jgi:tripartite-type tricarboxylate transporter receptor subunit TctC